MIIDVNLGLRSYHIVVESGALDTVGARLAELRVGSRAPLVSDAAILRLYGKTVGRSLESAGFRVATVEVPEGEAAKTLAVATLCWDALLAAGLDRTSTVLALGGGAVGDVAGFVAATYMRGVNFVQLPTTVLAQVDAAIGGKTAIDHPTAKNLIGAFHQPRLVICDPATTLTLSPREFESGLAEIVKHGVVLDADYFTEVERDAAALCARDLPVVERIVGGSCRLKAGVVERDERESELRHALNYGHTIGHALEAATGYARFAHGEAVALGIVADGPAPGAAPRGPRPPRPRPGDRRRSCPGGDDAGQEGARRPRALRAGTQDRRVPAPVRRAVGPRPRRPRRARTVADVDNRNPRSV